MTSDVAAVWKSLEQAQREGTTVATEPAGKNLLVNFGVAVPDSRVVISADEAVDAARVIGWPVVVKVVAPDLAHKSEVQGVVGPLYTVGEVRRAVSRISHPKEIGVMVERWEDDGVACFVGLNLKGQFGPTLSFGMGGIWIELLRDLSHRLAPVNEEEARDMILSVQAAPVFRGARNRAPVDLSALSAAVAHISTIANDPNAQRLINDLDVNPLLARTNGKPIALDATITLRKPFETS